MCVSSLWALWDWKHGGRGRTQWNQLNGDSWSCNSNGETEGNYKACGERENLPHVNTSATHMAELMMVEPSGMLKVLQCCTGERSRSQTVIQKTNKNQINCSFSHLWPLNFFILVKKTKKTTQTNLLLVAVIKTICEFLLACCPPWKFWNFACDWYTHSCHFLPANHSLDGEEHEKKKYGNFELVLYIPLIEISQHRTGVHVTRVVYCLLYNQKIF